MNKKNIKTIMVAILTLFGIFLSFGCVGNNRLPESAFVYLRVHLNQKKMALFAYDTATKSTWKIRDIPGMPNRTELINLLFFSISPSRKWIALSIPEESVPGKISNNIWKLSVDGEKLIRVTQITPSTSDKKCRDSSECNSDSKEKYCHPWWRKCENKNFLEIVGIPSWSKDEKEIWSSVKRWDSKIQLASVPSEGGEIKVYDTVHKCRVNGFPSLNPKKNSLVVEEVCSTKQRVLQLYQLPPKEPKLLMEISQKLFVLPGVRLKWNADGTNIFFFAIENFGSSQSIAGIFSITPETGKVSLVSKISDSILSPLHVVVSPSGNKIVYISRDASGALYNSFLYLLDTNTGKNEKIMKAYDEKEGIVAKIDW